MDENKIIELFHNKEFAEKFEDITTEEDAITLFKNNGVNIDYNNSNCLKNICDKYVGNNGRFNEEDLSEVVAGTDYLKVSSDVGEKLGALGAVTCDYCKSFANSCKKGYNDMALKLSEDKNNDV